MTASKPVLRRLEQAQRRRRLVRVTRQISGADRLEGFIVGVGRRWVLLAVLDEGFRPHGWVALRHRDIERVWRHADGERVARRHLRLHGAWPLGGPGDAVDLDRTSGLLTTVGRAFDTISVFIEHDDPDICFVGRLVAQGRKTFVVDEISPRGRWEATFRARRSRLSRLDFGGSYEAALAAVAGPWSRP